MSKNKKKKVVVKMQVTSNTVNPNKKAKLKKPNIVESKPIKQSKKAILKYVLYKLQANDDGCFTLPANIKKGGDIWKTSANIKDVIFVGQMCSSFIDDNANVIEVITNTKRLKHFESEDTMLLKAYKKQQFEQFTDVNFIEALRKKEMGNNKKWKEYIQRIAEIEEITEVPSFPEVINV